MTFNEWISKVVEHISTKYRKDPTEVYSSIYLTDAKLSFLDGMAPEDYQIN